MALDPNASTAPAAPFVWGPGGTPMTPQALENRRQIALAMQKQGADYSPIASPWQGVARVAEAMMGGYQSHKLDEKEYGARQASAAQNAQLLSSILGGGQGGANPYGGAAPASTPSASPSYSDASGGALPAVDVSHSGPNSVDPATIYSGLKARGLNDAQAYATLGNWKQESEFNPGAVNPGEGAIGLDQWRQDRRANLENFAKQAGKSPTDPEVQMDFYVNELKSHPGGQQFMAANDIPSANAALKTYIAYGSPYDKGGEGTRLANALAYQKMGFGTPDPNAPAAAATAAVASGGLPQQAPIPMPNPGADPSAAPVQTASLDPSAGLPLAPPAMPAPAQTQLAANGPPILPQNAPVPTGRDSVVQAMGGAPAAPAPPQAIPPAAPQGAPQGGAAQVAAAMTGQPQGQAPQAPMGGVLGNRSGIDPSQIAAISQAMSDPWASEGQQQLLGSVLSSRLTPHKIEMVPLGNGMTAEVDSITGQQVGTIKGAPSYTPIKDAAGNEYLVNPSDPTHPISTADFAQQQGGQTAQNGQPDQYASPFPRTMARTDVMKDYEGYLAQSKSLNQPPMSFNDYQMDLKKQGAQSIVFANENEAQKKIGEAIGGNMADYIDGAKDARSKLQALNEIKGVLDQYGGNISTGPGAQTMLSLKQGLANVFPGMADAATPTEMLQKMSTQLATADAKSLASRPTQFDFATYLKNNPGIQMSIAGQKALVDLKLQQAQHDYELGSMATHKQYSAHPDEWADVVAQYDKDHPLINPLTGKAADASATDFPAPKDGAPQQQEAAPVPGANKAPDGNWYVPDPARPGKYLKVVQ